jgi:formamidopyrimidine-DNA glycosylase
MPELPEVEAQRRSLLAPLIGATVAGVDIFRSDICDCANAQGSLHNPTPRDLGLAATITRIDRIGKQMAIISHDDRVMNVHLGMTGMLIALAEGQQHHQPDHIHLRWTLSRNNQPAGTLLFRDPRRFGGIWTFPTHAALLQYRWHNLGPDALTITADQLQTRLQNSDRAIKAALLDQRIIAGVGNIYADESLFRAGVAPHTRCSRLKPAQWTSLANALTGTLSTAIALGGSTLSDGTYTDSTGKAGGFQNHHKVYGRAGKLCALCKTELRTKPIAQRTTVWCPTCQP